MTYLNLFGRKVKAKDVVNRNGKSVDDIINDVSDNSNKCNSIKDYVIEQGLKSDWYYRKWDSGKMECWRRSEGKCTGSGSWGNMYAYYCPLTNSYPYSFVEKPVLTVTLLGTDNGSNGWLASMLEGRRDSNTSPGAYQLVRPSICATPTTTISYYAIGRWK